jgi:molecular chaperone DnaJ
MAIHSKRDYYEVLGVERNADQRNIKQKYRKLAFQYHPDRNSGDVAAESKFKEISEAYQVLSDPSKRQKYDQFGHQGLNGSGFQPFTGFDDIFESFGDIFGDFFGGGRRSRSRAAAGQDLRYDLNIDFMDAIKGTEKQIDVQKLEVCETCMGSGSRPGTAPVTCQHCGGSGQVRRSQGFFMISTPCPQCNGSGQFLQDPCDGCKGSGRNEKRKKLTVRIPAGVDSGSRIRLKAEGEPGMFGGPNGDLYIILHVGDHEIYQRHGDDVLMEYPITFAQAALGTTVTVEMLEEQETLKIPPGTQTGKSFVFRGKGVISLRSGRKGDFFVKIVVVTPTRLNAQQKHLLEELRKLDGEAVLPPKKKTLFEKIKDSIS